VDFLETSEYYALIPDLAIPACPPARSSSAQYQFRFELKPKGHLDLRRARGMALWYQRSFCLKSKSPNEAGDKA